MSDHYQFIRKELKHARIRVSEDGCIRVFIPNNFTETDIELLLKKKQNWIKQQQLFFKQKTKIGLGRNQLLLFGSRYHYFYDNTFVRKIVLDHNFKTIRASRNLLNKDIQIKWYKSVAKRYLVKRIDELAMRLGFKYNKIYIRDQRTKWGNCSQDKNISLNWRLIKAPTIVIDYLIVHELVHTKIMKHSTKFWTMLRSHYPDYKAAIDWLDHYGNSL